MIIGKLGKHKTKAIGAIVTLAVLAILVLAGPANAFQITLNKLPNNPVTKGTIVTIKGKIIIDSNEFLNNSETVNLLIDGPGNNDRSCNFMLNGTPVSGCDGISIRTETNATFGYGYGYGFTNGNIFYIIKINTTGFANGNHFVRLLFHDKDTQREKFVIVPKGDGDKKETICHTPPGNPAGKETLRVAPSAVAAHLAHGDYLGECRPN